MIDIVLAPGDSIKVGFKDADGEFQITFGHRKITVRETAHLPDDKGRKGVLYESRFIEEDGKSSVVKMGEASDVNPLPGISS